MEDNRLSAFKMRNLLGMKKIYDFISSPSIFPDIYFEVFFLVPIVTVRIQVYSFLHTFCSVIIPSERVLRD